MPVDCAIRRVRDTVAMVAKSPDGRKIYHDSLCLPIDDYEICPLLSSDRQGGAWAARRRLTYPVLNTPIPKSNSYAGAVDPWLCCYLLMGQHVSQDCGSGTQ